jgi:hypothetical protein
VTAIPTQNNRKTAKTQRWKRLRQAFSYQALVFVPGGGFGHISLNGSELFLMIWRPFANEIRALRSRNSKS